MLDTGCKSLEISSAKEKLIKFHYI